MRGREKERVKTSNTHIKIIITSLPLPLFSIQILNDLCSHPVSRAPQNRSLVAIERVILRTKGQMPSNSSREMSAFSTGKTRKSPTKKIQQITAVGKINKDNRTIRERVTTHLRHSLLLSPGFHPTSSTPPISPAEELPAFLCWKLPTLSPRSPSHGPRDRLTSHMSIDLP